MTSTTRPRYRERRLLRTAELTDEQQTRLARRRRHDIGHHEWGIVTGLEPVVSGTALAVTPGYAVDGYGRGLVVATARPVPADVFDRLEADRVEVWLVHCRVASDVPVRGRRLCGPDLHGRWSEQTTLLLAAGTGHPDPRRPPGVPARDLDFEPHRAGADEGLPPWPVYLGALVRSAQDADLEGRAYAGMVGESLRAPGSGVRLQLGAELGTDRRRFAVLHPASGELLAFDADGAVRVRADNTMHGDLHLVTRAGDVRGLRFRPLAAVPDEAAPWQAYLVQTADRRHALRFEIGNPGDQGDPASHRLAIGHTDGATFVPCLTVAADCTVTLTGDLAVEGLIVQGPIPADPTDPRFVKALMGTWIAGAVATSAELALIYSGEVEVEATVQAPPPAADGTTAVVGGAPLSYAVTVRNSGPVQVGDVRVTETLTIAGEVVREEVVAASGALEAGATIDIARTFTPPADAVGETLEIVMAAAATGPAPYPIVGSATLDVAILSGVIL